MLYLFEGISSNYSVLEDIPRLAGMAIMVSAMGFYAICLGGDLIKEYKDKKNFEKESKLEKDIK